MLSPVTSSSSTVIPLPATTVVPLALIFTLSPSLTISLMFVPASSLPCKASAVTPLLANSLNCFIFTASPSAVPSAMFVILLPPLFKPSLFNTTCSLDVSLGVISTPLPFITVLSPAAFLNSAEVRPFRALAKAIVNLPFSVSSASAKVMMFAPLSNVSHLSVVPAVFLLSPEP